LIKSELLESYGVDIQNPALLTRMLKGGNIILILDGLDEMSKKQGGRSALMAYYRLNLPVNGPKVIITCRTHYFYSGSEQREVINIDEKILSIDKMPTFNVVHLKMFDKPKLSNRQKVL
jgi:predicted NACHT family NTPase